MAKQKKTVYEGQYKRTKERKVVGKHTKPDGSPVTVIRETYKDRPIKKKR
tara:strand:+ start:571 stop:720 length:150 start_codon:yes stop_codon:yes gene_type:complete